MAEKSVSHLLLHIPTTDKDSTEKSVQGALDKKVKNHPRYFLFIIFSGLLECIALIWECIISLVHQDGGIPIDVLIAFPVAFVVLAVLSFKGERIKVPTVIWLHSFYVILNLIIVPLLIGRIKNLDQLEFDLIFAGLAETVCSWYGIGDFLLLEPKVNEKVKSWFSRTSIYAIIGIALDVILAAWLFWPSTSGQHTVNLPFGATVLFPLISFHYLKQVYDERIHPVRDTKGRTHDEAIADIEKELGDNRTAINSIIKEQEKSGKDGYFKRIISYFLK
ncbi:hypothetical protein PT279_07880 [Bifidobacterium sp. ESL0784]|uniref:hypothetical protein n=1 Tax=Bifidobacterium sp. ESL0784 TaxID=2983231 RepID=UPI0023F92663|nr:hypothetical protein [Bifidobacterium sp. ESL0784]MDF7641502.1 hypothetical protein [Bifidobacterium sp. ESL0784]